MSAGTRTVMEWVADIVSHGDALLLAVLAVLTIVLVVVWRDGQDRPGRG